MAYANGFVPASALAPLDGQPGCFLRADAAAAWNAARAEVKRRTGIVLTVRGWNRSYAEQVTFYLQRHRLAKAGERVCCYWQGRPYKFTGTAHAAPPGTSNHGWGLAVDVSDFGNVGNFSHPRRVAAFPILAQYGWTDAEGRGAIREPWHLVWNPSSAYAVNNPIGGNGSINIPNTPGAPAPLEKEDDLSDENTQKILGAINTVAQEARVTAARLIAVETELANVKAGVWTGGSVTLDGKVQKFNYGVLPIVAHNQRLIAAQTAALTEISRQQAGASAGGATVAVDYDRIDRSIANAVKGTWTITKED